MTASLMSGTELARQIIAEAIAPEKDVDGVTIRQQTSSTCWTTTTSRYAVNVVKAADIVVAGYNENNTGDVASPEAVEKASKITQSPGCRTNDHRSPTGPNRSRRHRNPTHTQAMTATRHIAPNTHGKSPAPGRREPSRDQSRAQPTHRRRLRRRLPVGERRRHPPDPARRRNVTVHPGGSVTVTPAGAH